VRHVFSGMILVLLGCYAALNLREKVGRPREVRGLEPIQDVLGDRLGLAVYFIIFAVWPLGLGGYFMFTGLGGDRLWERGPGDETTELRSTPEEDAVLRLDMAEARLAGAGFSVVRLEHGEGLQVSEGSFSGAIRQFGSSWHVDCGAHDPYDVPSLNDAEAKILACHQPP
jgi:hypothetical protein